MSPAVSLAGGGGPEEAGGGGNDDRGTGGRSKLSAPGRVGGLTTPCCGAVGCRERERERERQNVIIIRSGVCLLVDQLT